MALSSLLRRSAVALISVAMLVAATPAARADYRIEGHGFGHGVGLAQYGAMGYARETGHTYRWILRRYFPGTTRAVGPSARMRVKLRQGAPATATMATLAEDVRGRRVALRGTRSYRSRPWGTDGLALVDVATGRTRAHLHAPVRLTGTEPLRLIGRADNGVTGGRYRGVLVLHRAGDEVMVINDVGLERYLYGVVPAEMPAGWPAEALRCQAVVARSYALTGRRPSALFDVFADTRSQVYRGLAAETGSTTDAVRSTRGIVLMFGPSIARTYFHSSSGGRTAAVDEAFGGSPVPYLRAVDDPYDRLSPHHDWTVTLTGEAAERRLESVLDGHLVAIEIVARTAGGRAAIVRVTGTLGTQDISGAAARTLLGLRSTWFTVTRQPASR